MCIDAVDRALSLDLVFKRPFDSEELKSKTVNTQRKQKNIYTAHVEHTRIYIVLENEENNKLLDDVMRLFSSRKMRYVATRVDEKETEQQEEND